MIFKCINPLDIICNLVDQSRQKKRDRGWHRKFVWHPVKLVDGDCCWLQYVQRSFVRKYSYVEILKTIYRLEE